MRNVLLANVVVLALCVSSVYGQGHDLVIQSGATFSGTGTITVKDSIINSGDTAATVIPGTVVLSNTSNQAIGSASSKSIQFGTLRLQGAGTKTQLVTVTVTDSLNIMSGATLNISGDTLRIASLSGNSGTITTSASSVLEYTRSDGIASQSIMAGTFSGKIRLLNNSRKILSGVTAADSLEQSGWGLSVGSNLTTNIKATIDSLLSVTSGITLQLGSSASTITRLVGNAGTISTSAGTITFPNDITNTGTITTATGTINLNGTGTQTNTGGIISVTGAGALNIAGNIATSPGTLTLAAASTTTFNGSAQTVPAINYGNLVLANTGLKTLAGTTGIAGSLTISSGATSDAVTNSTTVNYNGTGAQTIGALKYYNLTLGNTGSSALTLVSGDTIHVAGTFTNSASSATFVNTGNTFEYNSASAQTVTAFSYNNLLLKGGGTKTVTASQTTSGNVVQVSGTALIINTGVVWQINGNFSVQEAITNNGTVTVGS